MASKAVRMDGRVADQWKRVRGRLRAELGEAAFKTWLRPLSLDGVQGGEVVMRVPNGNMKDWVMSRCGARLRDLWRSENRQFTDIAIRVGKAPRRSERRALPASGQDLDMVPHDAGVGARVGGEGEADRAAVQLDRRFTFEHFVVGRSNEFARAAALRIAEADRVAFNPLFLYGGVGLGKTHLMQAVAWHIRARDPGRRVLYMSAETFMYKFVHALRGQDTMAFKDRFRAVDVLMIDDIQFIAGKASTQEEFFHTFNALVDGNRQVVVSGDRAPGEIEGLGERLRSRLYRGLVADIHPADYELRLGIVRAKAAQARAGQFGDVEVPPRVMEFLAHKICSNVRELEGALNRVLAHAQLVGRPVTLEATQELMRDLLRAQDRRLTIEDIQNKVARHYGIRPADMLSSRKQRAIARPRQVAMYLAKRLTSRSLPEIGRQFGGRDHTTVMHGVRRIEQLMGEDAGLADDVELLERMLES